jgi:hypothetical protein
MAPLDTIKTFQSWDRLKDWSKWLQEKWDKDKQTSNTKGIIACALMWVIWTATVVWGQDIAWQDCYVEISDTDNWGKVINKECDLSNPAWGIITSEPYRVPLAYSPEHYRDILNSADYDIIDENGFRDFLNNFGWMLEFLWKKSELTGTSINISIDLYDAAKIRGENPIWYADAYDDFLKYYSNPDLDMIGELDKHGYPHHGLI